MSRRTPAPPRPAPPAPLALRFCGLRLRAPGDTLPALDTQRKRRRRPDLPDEVRDTRLLPVADLLEFLARQLHSLRSGNASAIYSERARRRFATAAPPPFTGATPEQRRDAFDSLHLWALHSAEIELPRGFVDGARLLCSDEFRDVFKESILMRYLKPKAQRNSDRSLFELLSDVLFSDAERSQFRALDRLSEDHRMLRNFGSARLQILRMRLAAALLYPRLQAAVLAGLSGCRPDARPPADAGLPDGPATLDFAVGCLPAQTERGPATGQDRTRPTMTLSCVLCVSFHDIDLSQDLLPQLKAAALRDEATLRLPPLSGYSPLLRRAAQTTAPVRRSMQRGAEQTLSRRLPGLSVQQMLRIQDRIFAQESKGAWEVLASLLTGPLARPDDFLWRLLDENHPDPDNPDQRIRGPAAAALWSAAAGALWSAGDGPLLFDRLAFGLQPPDDATVDNITEATRADALQTSPMPFVRLSGRRISPGDAIHFMPFTDDVTDFFAQAMLSLPHRQNLTEYSRPKQYIAGMPLAALSHHMYENPVIQDVNTTKRQILEHIKSIYKANVLVRAFGVRLRPDYGASPGEAVAPGSMLAHMLLDADPARGLSARNGPSFLPVGN